MHERLSIDVQAVLVTNQIYAGSLGADALAAAAIGFTARVQLTDIANILQSYYQCLRRLCLLDRVMDLQVKSARDERLEICVMACSSST